MSRPRLHDTDSILDASLTVVLDRGAPAATIEAIAAESGAPTGSIYHAFGSREALLTRMWIRAARRSQDRFLAAAQAPGEPRATALAAAMSVFEFARECPGDARLLASMRREDLVRTSGDPSLVEELTQLNRPIERAIRELASRLVGSGADGHAREAVALATIDIPYGAVRRHLGAGRRPPASLRAPLERAVGAAIDAVRRDGDQGEHASRG
jgi:AcrR family transcriptional regulator